MMTSAETDWLDVEPEVKKAASPAQEPVRFGVAAMRQGLPKRGRVLIRREILQRLGMTHFRVNVKLGSGPHAGRVAIVPAVGGKFELQEVGVSKGGGTFRLTLPHIAAWTDYPCDMGPCDWKVGKIFGKTEALFLDLPKPLVSQPHFELWKSGKGA